MESPRAASWSAPTLHIYRIADSCARCFAKGDQVLRKEVGLAFVVFKFARLSLLWSSKARLSLFVEVTIASTYNNIYSYKTTYRYIGLKGCKLVINIGVKVTGEYPVTVKNPAVTNHSRVVGREGRLAPCVAPVGQSWR